MTRLPSRTSPKKTPQPKGKKGGKCIQCGKPVVIHPRPGLDPSLYADPFCSTVCAKAYHGVAA